MKKAVVILALCLAITVSQAQTLAPLKKMLSSQDIASSTTTPASASSTKLVDREQARGRSHFRWQYAGETYSISVVTNMAVGGDYATKTVQYTEDDSYYRQFLKTIDGDSTIQQLARRLQNIAMVEHYDRRQLAELAAALVQQSVDYDTSKTNNSQLHREVFGRWCSFPTQTVISRSGVCIDKAILLQAIYNELGFSTCLLISRNASHAAVGLRTTADTYLYVETTGDWGIGNMPDSIKPFKKTFAVVAVCLGSGLEL